jgi:hypothetical protein
MYVFYRGINYGLDLNENRKILYMSVGDETQHLYVVSLTNLQLFIESAELSLSRWRSFGGWFATVEEL